jgi:hypothetical protein
MHQGRPVQPELNPKLQYVYTLREEIVRIRFQQEMLRETVAHLERRSEQLRKEYETGS